LRQDWESKERGDVIIGMGKKHGKERQEEENLQLIQRQLTKENK